MFIGKHFIESKITEYAIYVVVDNLFTNSKSITYIEGRSDSSNL